MQALGVKRGLDRECVVAPYATFLALPFDLDGGMKNLDRLEALGMAGRYGFYEAADFTPGAPRREALRWCAPIWRTMSA